MSVPMESPKSFITEPRLIRKILARLGEINSPPASARPSAPDRRGDDVLRGLNERHVQERRQPVARLDLGAVPSVFWRFTEQAAKRLLFVGAEHEGPPDREPRSFPSNSQCRRWDLNPHALAGNGF